jgi:phosphohistidine phosphatase
MKRLTLLRHAKSSWDDAVPRDFDRPLNARGLKAARTMGRWMKDEGLAFDHVVASPAVRVTETLDAVWDGYGQTLKPVWDRRIYLASCVNLLDVVRETPADVTDLLMAGHNPGLEDLVLMLVPDGSGDPLRDALEEKYPTAALAVMEFDGDWSALEPRTARLVRFVRPRDLDPDLGPED